MINTKLVDVFYTYHNNLTITTTTTTTMTTTTTSSQDILVCNDYKYKKRQIPLLVDDSLIVILEFEDVFEKLNTMCKACELHQQSNISNKQEQKMKKDYETFLNKYNSLLLNSRGENADENTLTNKLIKSDQSNLILQLSKLISCIGCRTSIERFYKQLVKYTNSSTTTNKTTACDIGEKACYAIDPFLIDSSGNLTLKESFINDPSAVYSLFYLNCFKLEEIIEQIIKCKKSNRRCNLHSLDYLTKTFHQQQQLQLQLQQIRSLSPTMPTTSASLGSSSSTKITIDEASSTTTITTTTRSLSSLSSTSTSLLTTSASITSSINSDWLIVWDSFSSDQLRLKSLIIDTSKLLITLDNYLRKHKFCSDCKLKVVKAFHLLIGEADPQKEKGFCANLYEGIKCCSRSAPVNTNCFYLKSTSSQKADSNATATVTPTKSQTNASVNGKNSTKKDNNLNKHLHLINDKKFISNLISKAEPEILGSRRERHAKTIDIAQEEVLTCIGIHLYERFHQIYQTMKSEEQTWLLLYYSSLNTLKKCLELEFEKIQGVSNLELICAELEALDELQEERKRIKKERKKQRKLNKNKTAKNAVVHTADEPINNENNTSCTNKNEDNEDNESVSSSDKIIKNDDDEYEDELEMQHTEEDNDNFNDSKVNLDDNNNSSFKDDEKQDQEDQMSPNNKPDSCGCVLNLNETNQATNLFNSNAMSLSSSSSTSSTSSCHKLADENVNLYFFDTDAQHGSIFDQQDNVDDSLVLITDEEKNEYYANKSMYLTERINRREMLKQKFQNLKLNANFKIRPRNVS